MTGGQTSDAVVADTQKLLIRPQFAAAQAD